MVIADSVRAASGPDFFRPTPENSEITASFFGFAEFAYLDSPLDSRFKERLFVFLSRFSDVRCCILRHVGFLIGLGHAAGDEYAPVQTIEEIIRPLSRPLPRAEHLNSFLAVLNECSVLSGETLAPESACETAVFACAMHVFLQTADAARCLGALRRVYGESEMQSLLVFLALVRTAHFWAKVQTDLRLEDDIKELLADNEHLAEVLLSDPEAMALCEVSPSLLEEASSLRSEKQQGNERLSQAQAPGPYTDREIRRTGAELAARVVELQTLNDIIRDSRRAALNVMEDALLSREASRVSEEKFRILANAAPALIWQNNPQGENLFINQHFLDFVGKTAEELRGRGWHTIVHPDDADAYIAGYLEAVREKRDWRDSNRIRRHDGEWRWFDNYGAPLFDAGGAYLGHVGITIDITERKQGEENSRKGEEQQAFLLKLSDAIRFLESPQEIEQAAMRMLGLHLDATRAFYFLTEPAAGGDWVHSIESDYRRDPAMTSYAEQHFVSDFELKLFEGAEHGKVVTVDDVTQVSALTPAQIEKYLAVDVAAFVNVPLIKDGKFIAGIGLHDSSARAWKPAEIALIQEVAERTWSAAERRRAEEAVRESEGRFRTLSDAVPQIIWTNTADGAADYFNQRWYRYTGLSDQQSAGPGWQAVVHPDDASVSAEKWQQALAAGSVFDTEYRLRGADGEFRWFLGRSVPLKNAAGEVTAWFGSATDIEEWKQAQAARQESEERFRLLVEGARDYAMFLLDTQGRVTFWSAGAERIFGYAEAEALGQPIALIFTAEDQEQGAAEREREQARADGQATDRRWHLRRDGTRFWADGMLMRLNDERGGLRGFAKVMRDATDQWRAQEDVRQAMQAVASANADLEERVEERTAQWREAAAARQEMTRRLVDAEEEERRRLSRELHDQTGQHLTGLLLGLDALRSSQPADNESALLAERLRQAAADLSREVHQLAWDLRPPALDDIGLSQTLFSYVQEWGSRSLVAADFFAPDWDGERLAPEVETALYRMVQEALTNISRHARAGRVSVVLERRDHGAVLVVEDDGVGFDSAVSLASSARLGLRGMRERIEMVGGTLEIESVLAGGTTLVVRVPTVTEQSAAVVLENADA